MATCEAAGPSAIVCSVVVTFSITGLPAASLIGTPSGPFFGCS